MVTAIVAGVTAAASLAGSVAKTIQAKRQARRAQAQLDKMKSDNEAWYQRRYNEDFTQRSEIQNALNQSRENLIRQTKAISGTQAVMGGTDASAAAAKESANNAYANAVANAAAGASAAKDKVEDRYLNTKNTLANQQIAADQARTDANAAAIDTAVNGINAAGQAFVAGSDLGATAKSASGGYTLKDVKSTTPSPLNMEGVQNGNPVSTVGSDFAKANQKRLEETTKIPNLATLLMR